MPRYSDLMRRPHKGRPWPIWWYDPRTGELLRPENRPPLILDTPESVAPLLTMIAPRGAEGSTVVYIAAGETAETAPDPDWYRSAARDGWEVEYRGGSPKDRCAVMLRDGAEVHVRHIAAWYGGDPSPRLARTAHDMLLKRLTRDFGRDGDSVILYGTPAQTGLMLLDISLPRDKAGKPYRYPVISDAPRDLLDEVIFQHRKELFTDLRDEIPGYSVYDARLSYAAYLRDVPVGEPVCERTNAYAEYRPGWYRVTIDAPKEWGHIGLAKAITHGDWPRAGRFDTWISEPELRLLLRTPGWRAQIHERIYWPARRPGDDPLRTWGERLIAEYQDAEKLADLELRHMLKGAIRHLIHDSLGSFKRGHAVKSVIVPYGKRIDPSTVVAQGPYGYECKIPVAISPDRMRYYQPQIAGHIWARNRAELARYALRWRFGDILALQTDAVHVSMYAGYRKREPVPIGSYRLKGTLDGPLPSPLDFSDLAAYAEHAETVYTAFYHDLYDKGAELDG